MYRFILHLQRNRKLKRYKAMATQKYNKSEIMKSAHTLYKECKQYGRTLGSCLKQAWASAKAMVRLTEQRATFQKQMEERKHDVVLSHVGMNSLYANRVYSGD